MMTHNICPNYQSCRLVNLDSFPVGESEKQTYLENWCLRDEAGWSRCKRYLTRDELGFCPDFVLPDSTWNSGEIMDKFDEEEV